jgi:hypothetical protein
VSAALHVSFLAARLIGAALILLGAATSWWRGWIERPTWWAMASFTCVLWAAHSAWDGLLLWFLVQIGCAFAAFVITYQLVDQRASRRRRRVSHRG